MEKTERPGRGRTHLFMAYLVLSLILGGRSRGAAPDDVAAPATLPTEASSLRYGPFNLLDHRSTYGQFWFVEPLRAPEMDVDRELRLDYLHGEARGFQSNLAKAEIEYNFNLLTLELELPYESNRMRAFNPITRRSTVVEERGIGTIELAARHPVFQYVSAGGAIDYTLAGAFELAVPSNSPISKDTEFVPQLFQLLRVGDHLSIEASTGLSMLAGPLQGGTNTFEYNLVVGYNLEHDELCLPGVLRTIPIFELNGEYVTHGAERGADRLFGTTGFRLNFEPIGLAQPRIGVGYVFPIDSGARRELRWGIITSLVFEF